MSPTSVGKKIFFSKHLLAHYSFLLHKIIEISAGRDIKSIYSLSILIPGDDFFFW